MSNSDTFLYDAFISYRHANPDRLFAERLHRLLEAYRVPRALVRAGKPRRLRRVFRDHDELSTSSNLAAPIIAALEQSRFLIVICSSQTPASLWVGREVETFQRLGRGSRILPLLIEGEPDQAFPPSLKRESAESPHAQAAGGPDEKIEPLAADVRAPSLAASLRALRREKLRVLAPMLECRFDDLRQRHQERFARRLAFTTVGLVLLLASFLALGVAVYIEKKKAEARLAQAMQAVELTIHSLTLKSEAANLDRRIYEMEQAEKILDGLLKDDATNVRALGNLRSARAVLAALYDEAGSPVERDAKRAATKMVASRLAVNALRQWVDTMGTPPAGGLARFGWQDDRETQRLKGLLAILEQPGTGALPLNLSMMYIDNLIEYVVRLDITAEDERAEVRRVITRAFDNLRHASAREHLTVDQAAISTILQEALRKLDVTTTPSKPQ